MRRRGVPAGLGLLLTLFAGSGDLHARHGITPTAIMHRVRGFHYELAAQVQDPRRFLERGRGDCDDFARWAAEVLTEAGYRPRLVMVRMAREAHVVCYLPELTGYLDFNRRAEADPLVSVAPSLERVAARVARDFGGPWIEAAEVRFEGQRPVILRRVLAPAPAPRRAQR